MEGGSSDTTSPGWGGGTTQLKRSLSSVERGLRAEFQVALDQRDAQMAQAMEEWKDTVQKRAFEFIQVDGTQIFHITESRNAREIQHCSHSTRTMFFYTCCNSFCTALC